MSTIAVGEASGHSNIGPTWDEDKPVDQGMLETSRNLQPELPPTAQNMFIGTANSSNIASSSTVSQAKAIIKPSAEDIAVSEAIDAIEDLTSDFEAITDESNTEEVPCELVPKAAKRGNSKGHKLKSGAGPSQKMERARFRLINDSPGNNNTGPFSSGDGYENGSLSSPWTDDESWGTPSFLRYDAERPPVYRSMPPHKTVRQRVASLKRKVVQSARTDLDWVKGAITSIYTKSGAEYPELKARSTEKSRVGSEDSSILSLRGGAGDIWSLDGGGNDIMGFGGGSNACVSSCTHKFRP